MAESFTGNAVIPKQSVERRDDALTLLLKDLKPGETFIIAKEIQRRLTGPGIANARVRTFDNTIPDDLEPTVRVYRVEPSTNPQAAFQTANPDYREIISSQLVANEISKQIKGTGAEKIQARQERLQEFLQIIKNNRGMFGNDQNTVAESVKNAIRDMFSPILKNIMNLQLLTASLDKEKKAPETLPVKFSAIARREDEFGYDTGSEIRRPKRPRAKQETPYSLLKRIALYSQLNYSISVKMFNNQRSMLSVLQQIAKNTSRRNGSFTGQDQGQGSSRQKRQPSQSQGSQPTAPTPQPTTQTAKMPEKSMLSEIRSFLRRRYLGKITVADREIRRYSNEPTESLEHLLRQSIVRNVSRFAIRPMRIGRLLLSKKGRSLVKDTWTKRTNKIRSVSGNIIRGVRNSVSKTYNFGSKVIRNGLTIGSAANRNVRRTASRVGGALSVNFERFMTIAGGTFTKVSKLVSEGLVFIRLFKTGVVLTILKVGTAVAAATAVFLSAKALFDKLFNMVDGIFANAADKFISIIKDGFSSILSGFDSLFSWLGINNKPTAPTQRESRLKANEKLQSVGINERLDNTQTTDLMNELSKMKDSDGNPLTIESATPSQIKDAFIAIKKPSVTPVVKDLGIQGTGNMAAITPPYIPSDSLNVNQVLDNVRQSKAAPSNNTTVIAPQSQTVVNSSGDSAPPVFITPKSQDPSFMRIMDRNMAIGYY